MATLLNEAVKVNQEVLKGEARLQDFRKVPKKTGGYFGVGTLVAKGGEQLSYKIWDEQLIETLEEVIRTQGEGFYVELQGKGDTYGGKFSVIIESIRVPDQTQFKLADFYNIEHDYSELMGKVNAILGEKTTPKARKLVGEILNGSLAERFVFEFAGKTMHDATPVGLLNHTTKMMQLTELIMAQHNNFGQEQDNIDLMYVGVLLHDIGKTLELKDGVYTPISIATHRFLGAEVIYEHKSTIVSLYGELWYYNLIAVITQHHGQYEERPRTIFSYITHLIDNFDTGLTIVEERVKDLNSGDEIRLGEFRLKIEK